MSEANKSVDAFICKISPAILCQLEVCEVFANIVMPLKALA